jgi:hypothetical protein
MESALSGRILKIFPFLMINNKWVSSLELNEAGLKEWILHIQECFTLVFWFFK